MLDEDEARLVVAIRLITDLARRRPELLTRERVIDAVLEMGTAVEGGLAATTPAAWGVAPPPGRGDA